MSNQRELVDTEDLVYSSLAPGEIRMLSLLPGSFSDEIKISMTSVSIDTLPFYEALSYVWGNQTERWHISVNNRKFNVAESLVTALRHLRDELFPRLLWIDAICIDQSNSEEKTVQVRMMRSIYSKAKRVTIWLGAEYLEDSEYAALGMDILKYLTADWDLTTWVPWDNKSNYQISLALARVIGNPWWRRIWVVQEIAVAREAYLMCGPHSFEWPTKIDRIREVSKRIKFVEIAPQWQARFKDADFGDILETLATQELLRSPNKPKLLDLAHALRKRQSTDPRDKIFALVGLTDDEDDTHGVIDYGLSVDQVYSRLAKLSFLKETPLPRENDRLGTSLSIFGFAGEFTRKLMSGQSR